MRLGVILLVVYVFSFSVSALRPFERNRTASYIAQSHFYVVSPSCKRALTQITIHMNNSRDLAIERYLSSFSIGKSAEFVSDDRWLHNMLKCFYSDVRHRSAVSFCFGQEPHQGNAVALCLPFECAVDVGELLERWKETSVSLNATLEGHTCTTSRHEKPWYLEGTALLQMLVLTSIAAVVFIATASHERIQSSRNWNSQALYAFSLKRNVRKLLEMPSDTQSTITCMFGLRFISMLWTLVGHSFAWIQPSIDNVEEYKDDILNNFSNLWITNFTVTVDTFFVLSATLTSFSWFRKVLKGNSEYESLTWRSWSFWAKFYRHRIFRLWPACVFTVSSVTFLLSSLHAHAMWPPSDPGVQCRRHGWQNALFLNSLFGGECMGWLWYIGTEFIFYLVSPIFLLSLKRSSVFGFFISISTIVFSNVLRTMIMIVKRYPPTPLVYRQYPAFNGSFMQQINDYYVKPQYRIGPYVIGILLGYILARRQNTKQRAHSTTFKLIGWTMCSTFGIGSLFGIYPATVGWEWPLYNALFGGVFRTCWALSVAWVIYACHTGISRTLNTLLSFHFLIPLSSLCYSVYLIHLLIVFAVYLWSPFPLHYTSKAPIFALCVPQLLLSYVAAFAISMGAEIPALNLERVFFPDSVKKSTAYLNNNYRQTLFILEKK